MDQCYDGQGDIIRIPNYLKVLACKRQLMYSDSPVSIPRNCPGTRLGGQFFQFYTVSPPTGCFHVVVVVVVVVRRPAQAPAPGPPRII